MIYVIYIFIIKAHFLLFKLQKNLGCGEYFSNYWKTKTKISLTLEKGLKKFDLF